VAASGIQVDSDKVKGPYKVKITVLKRFHPSEVFEKSPVTLTKPQGACEHLREGQEFVVTENGKMPEGFCFWAWNTIFPDMRTLRWGGEFSSFKEKGVAVDCCTDGLRPVIFKLERLND